MAGIRKNDGLWRRLTSPSARGSVLALLVLEVVIGAAAVIGWQRGAKQYSRAHHAPTVVLCSG